jgi:hypothetical protein
VRFIPQFGYAQSTLRLRRKGKAGAGAEEDEEEEAYSGITLE